MLLIPRPFFNEMYTKLLNVTFYLETHTTVHIT